MNKAYLLIGGNEGDRPGYLQEARGLIGENCGKITAFSGLYETAAWGKTDQPAFLNQALLIETGMSPTALMNCLLKTEQKMGRMRAEKYGQRIIDIDILFFEDRIINEENLIIPHPQMEHRRFALVPLHEIAATFIHPLLHQSINELLLKCKDTLDVKKL